MIRYIRIIDTLGYGDRDTSAALPAFPSPLFLVPFFQLFPFPFSLFPFPLSAFSRVTDY